MKDIVHFIKQRDGLLAYFPVEEEIPKCGKEWVTNMLQTLCFDDFQFFVGEQEMKHRAKIDEARKL